MEGAIEHTSERAQISALLAGDEAEFARFAARHHPILIKVAAARLGRASPLVDEVVQEAWVVFLEALPRFEARSSVRTFLVGILINVLRNRARAEARSVPFSALTGDDDEGPAVAADRFLPPDDPWAGHWASSPSPWTIDPGDRARMRAAIEAAIDALPPAQREVLTLRDVLGWDGDEVCSALSLSDTHQRVLLHRARSKVRSALETRFGGER